MKKNIITFIDNSDTSVLEMPELARKNFPSWYLDHKNYLPDSNFEKKPVENLQTSATIKRCVPIMDILSSGYIIKTAVDIYVEQRYENGKQYPYFIYPDNNYIKTHSRNQADIGMKEMDGLYFIPKRVSLWGIKTPRGYSCLFIPPVYRDNIIKVLPGIVDTDTYNISVEFPFILSDSKFEGLIPKGTPIVQVMPFKRDSWRSKLSLDKKIFNSQSGKLKSVFFDGYRNMFWNKKDYS